ncbi:MAG: thiol:disulfide interchange protein DsbA/DsbL [Rhodocyclaceae bacterium]|nr:thiol:disulfide interchange protein DsbA/DsbL [Rhodocyclaceae bacterium]
MDRRQALKNVAVLAGLAATGGRAFAQGRSYNTLDPAQPTEDASRIEIIEFFHYGCPHCRDFDPLLEAWLVNLPGDVTFKRVPAIWGNAKLKQLARLYYSAEATGDLHTLHGEVFAAFQTSKIPLDTEPGVRDWVAGKGLDADKFMAAYKSFGIQSKLARAEQLARNFRVQGVPTMAVDGKYTTSASLTGSHENTLKVIDELIAKVRAERG